METAEPSDLESARVLSGKLIAVAERAKADFAALAAEHDLTAMQARAVLFLGTSRTMGEVGEHLRCDRPNVTGLADRLEQRGLVERVPGSDRRVRLLGLTESGRRTRDGLQATVSRGSTVMSRLDASQRRRLEGLLDELLG